MHVIHRSLAALRGPVGALTAAVTRPRRMSQRALAVAAIVVALVVPATAYAWATNYVLYTYFNPGGIGLSGYNSGINWNESEFQNSFAGDRMQLTLCDTSYNCYPYTYDSDGFVSDSRSISYGRAKCNSYQNNAGQIYVHWCYTRN